MNPRTRLVPLLFLATFALVSIPASAELGLNLGPEERVQAGAGDIVVPGYSVPSFDDWNNDNLKDLIVGEGSGLEPNARVRVYLNIGTESDPQFADFFYAQSAGVDLSGVGGG